MVNKEQITQAQTAFKMAKLAKVAELKAKMALDLERWVEEDGVTEVRELLHEAYENGTPVGELRGLTGCYSNAKPWRELWGTKEVRHGRPTNGGKW